MTVVDLARPAVLEDLIDAGMPAPKFATRRDPTRRTLGTQQTAFARIWLGRRLMPWQRYVAEVAGELKPNGLPVYPFVVVTLQRQAGKSDLSMAQNGERCFARPDYRSWYTAQTGQDARDQFLKFNDETLAGTALAGVVRTMRGRGEEIMKFPNGSTLRPHPPTEEKLHGKQSDRNDIDEGWAFDLEEGKSLLQAIAPTQLTRPGAQTFVWSAGGTANSTWLSDLVSRGRKGDPSFAYFEWGIPDGLDLDDLEAIASHHPAFGHTITVDSLAALRVQTPDDGQWARAAGNRWTEAISGAIAWSSWEASRWSPPAPAGALFGYGAARAEDGSQVAIAAAWEVDGVIVCEVLDVLPTGYLAADHVKGWAGRDLVAVDPNGPSAGLHADLVRKRARLPKVFGSREASAACMNVLDALPVGGIRFRTHPDLDAAAKVAGKRRVGDGGYQWSRVDASAPIATLEACGAAAWALMNRPPSGKPEVTT